MLPVKNDQNRKIVRIRAPTCEISRDDVGCLIKRDRVAKKKQLVIKGRSKSFSKLEGE